MGSNVEEVAELSAQGDKLYVSHLLTGNHGDLQEAVQCAQAVFSNFCARAVVEQQPVGDDSAMLIVQYKLARSLFRRFLATRQAEDITVAIDLFQNLSQASPQSVTDGLPENCFHYLIVSRFVQDGNLDGFLQLNAPDVLSQALKPTLEMRVLTHDLEKADVFHYLETKFFAKVDQLQTNTEDLDSAIHLCRKALLFFAHSPVMASVTLYHQAILLLLRFSRHGILEDNMESISAFSNALRMRLPLQLVGPCLTFTCNMLVRRYEVLKWQEDLDNAYKYIQQAKRFFDAINHAKQSTRLDLQDGQVLECFDNLARVMRSRYLATGDLDDLNAAVDASSHVVDLAQAGGHKKNLPSFFSNLAENLKLRVQRFGHTKDMEVAIGALQRAVGLSAPDHPRKVQFLLSLSYMQAMQGRKLLDEGFADQAAKSLEEVLSIIDERVGLQHDLDMSFHEGLVTIALENSPGMKWSEESEALARANISSDSAYNPLAKHSYAILYSCHMERWEATRKGEVKEIDGAIPMPRKGEVKEIDGAIPMARKGEVKEIDGAIPMARKGEVKEIDGAIAMARSLVKSARQSPDELISALIRLAHCLYERYKSTGDDGNCKEAVTFLLKGFRRSAGAPFHRMRAGKAVIDILAEQKEWVRAHNLCQEMVNLLVILNGRSLDWQDKQVWLRQFSSQAALYASIAVHAGSEVWDVIDMLETCRGSILGHVIDNQTDLENLMKAAPEKAERFKTLQGEINAVINPSGNVSNLLEQIARRDTADRKIRELLDEIRNLAGFHRFLLGPSQDEAKAAAAAGPIVIVNISSIRSDFFIITKEKFVSFHLPELEYRKVKRYLDEDLGNFSFGSDLKEISEKNPKLKQLQNWLWQTCVKLVFDKLDTLVKGPARLQLWWIGIGIANSLPFHAAGIYTGKNPEGALLRGISSYTPTLKILIHGRQRSRNDINRPKREIQGKANMAIVLMPSTPGKTPLDGVKDEYEAILDVVSAKYTPTEIQHASAETVKKLLGEYEIMHFACHGKSVPIDPSGSHLLLQTQTSSSELVVDKLKVRDVAGANVSGKLAFLSACSTAQSELTTLRDEVLHLASGFQVAGFLHTVGNLWLADDDISAVLVRSFYQHLVDAGELGDGGNVARALNEALLDVAKSHAKNPLAWAQYVHFGI